MCLLALKHLVFLYKLIQGPQFKLSKICMLQQIEKLLLKRTTAGRRILSTTSLSTTSLAHFEVLLSMKILPAAKVLHQSSAGMAPRAAGKASAASSGCVCVA